MIFFVGSVQNIQGRHLIGWDEDAALRAAVWLGRWLLSACTCVLWLGYDPFCYVIWVILVKNDNTIFGGVLL